MRATSTPTASDADGRSAPGDPLPQIVVERAMYTSPGGEVWAAGTNALATKIQ
jgi:hypothetical protein